MNLGSYIFMATMASIAVTMVVSSYRDAKAFTRKMARDVFYSAQWKNKRNGKIYSVIHADAIDATNSSRGRATVVYAEHGAYPRQIYVRSLHEFVRKFTWWA